MKTKVYLYSNALMILTSIHHVYGAYIYDTPWRLHVLALSLPVLVFNGVVMKRSAGKFIRFTFLFVNLIVAIGLIGLYEGVYNHLVKNILYYAGTDSTIMIKLFPPSKYTMPNDFIFETTGILQALLFIPLIYHFIRSLYPGGREKQA